MFRIGVVGDLSLLTCVDLLARFLSSPAVTVKVSHEKIAREENKK